MLKLLAEIIFMILCGRDYRTLALAVINERFITTTQDLIGDIFAYKKIGGNWIENLVNDFVNKTGKYNKYKLVIILFTMYIILQCILFIRSYNRGSNHSPTNLLLL